MSKKVDTLIQDIYSYLTGDRKEVSRDLLNEFGARLIDKLHKQLTVREPVSLRLSNLSSGCRRRLWYALNKPESAEPLSGATKLKFIFGDIIEELILLLARLSGHKVEDEQREVSVNGVLGHIDAIIDGRLVDVKSASTIAFGKFKAGLTPENDSFGYLGQLGSYAHSIGTDVGSFLAVDKTLGNLTLDTHVFQERNWDEYTEDVRTAVSAADPPPRAYTDHEHGKSGNRALGTQCSYCPFKRECWPGLRRFAYARGPVDFTHVQSEPDVPEIR